MRNQTSWYPDSFVYLAPKEPVALLELVVKISATSWGCL